MTAVAVQGLLNSDVSGVFRSSEIIGVASCVSVAVSRRCCKRCRCQAGNCIYNTTAPQPPPPPIPHEHHHVFVRSCSVLCCYVAKYVFSATLFYTANPARVCYSVRALLFLLLCVPAGIHRFYALCLRGESLLHPMSSWHSR